MKTKIKLKWFLLMLICSTFIISSCNKYSLSREEAKEIILKSIEFPQQETGEIHIDVINVYTSMGYSGMQKTPYFDVVESYKMLEEEGVLSLEPIYNNSYLVTITHEGKKYQVGDSYLSNNMPSGYLKYKAVKVLLCNLEFNAIDGISINKENNTAVVDYTMQRTNITPFGKWANVDKKEPIIKTTVNFVLYDDGWRINN